jgi:hypothetical protein
MKGLVCTLLLCSLVGALASSSNVEAGEGQEVKGHYLRGEMVEGEKLKFCEPPPKDYPPPYVYPSPDYSPPYSPTPDYSPPYSPTPDYSPPYSPTPDYSPPYSPPDYKSSPYSPKPDYSTSRLRLLTSPHLHSYDIGIALHVERSQRLRWEHHLMFTPQQHNFLLLSPAIEFILYPSLCDSRL